MKRLIYVILLGVALTGCASAPLEEPASEAPEEIANEEVTSETETVESEEPGSVGYDYETIAYEDGDHIRLEYPQIVGLKGELSMDYINQSLERITEIYANGNYKQVAITYEVTYMDSDYFSVLYTGTVEIDGFKSFDVVKSVTLDMHSTNEITVDNFVVGDMPLETLKEIFEMESISDFEAESVFMYFRNDQVVFYYMPLDDDADFRFIPIEIEGYGNYFNWDFGPHPAS